MRIESGKDKLWMTSFTPREICAPECYLIESGVFCDAKDIIEIIVCQNKIYDVVAFVFCVGIRFCW